MKKNKSFKTILALIAIAIIAIIPILGCDAPVPVVPPQGPAAVNLGTAGNYVMLAKTAISNVPTSAITGDVGLSPAFTAAITGFALVAQTGYATSAQSSGRFYAADMAAPTPASLTAAVLDMETAYADAAGRLVPDFTDLGTGNIGGLTLEPGLYNWAGGVTIPSNITISGRANDTWIFQINGTLTTSASVQIILAGGAQAKNIVWQVTGAVTLGADTTFEGIILGFTSVDMGANATLNGRVYAQTAVTLNADIINQPPM